MLSPLQKRVSTLRWGEVEGLPVGSINEGNSNQMSPFNVLKLFEQHSGLDMERYTSDLAVDYMQAYYEKVSLGGDFVI